MREASSHVWRLGYAAALTVFRWLPGTLRRTIVRVVTPGFTVGAVCAIDHHGALLFLRQPHRVGWSLPGGLLEQGERPADAVIREVREETGLAVDVGVPLTLQVNARVRRVDVVYRITVDERPAVRPAGEANSAAWLRPDELDGDIDGPTREILGVLDRALRPGATDGRVVRGA